MRLTPYTNNLEVRIYDKLPVYAVDIRNDVFVKEQGFTEEFDDNDRNAIHLVGFYDNRSVATSRVIKISDNRYLIGRIAVRKAYRGKGFGQQIVIAAEKEVKNLLGKEIFIHAQEQAKEFYLKLGYTPIGEPDEEEGCPHQMLHKVL